MPSELIHMNNLKSNSANTTNFDNRNNNNESSIKNERNQITKINNGDNINYNMDMHPNNNDQHNFVSNPNPELDCCVDTETFNQLLECCFDPSHLNPSYYEEIDLNTSTNNQNLNECHNHCHDGIINETSSIESLGVKTPAFTSNTVPDDILINCCSPIDLNPCNHDNKDIKSNFFDNTNDKNTADISEMVNLNNFFSSCCNDPSINFNDNDKHLFHNKNYIPTLPEVPNQVHLNQNLNNISSLRESLKSSHNISDSKNHHHHLLHLHHHDPSDSSKSHTHDIIYHHHNSNGCAHNNHANHHHHLHFQDQINGQKINHNFILPDCEIKKEPIENSNLITYNNNDNNNSNNNNIYDHHEISNNNNNNTNNNNNNQNLSDTNCVDFLTSSICNFDHDLKSNKTKNDGNNNELPIKVKMESPESLFSSSICKWDHCNTKVDSEELNKHLFESHLQYLPLSPDIVTNSNGHTSIHCGWDQCDFTTDEIDKFLEHVPEHTEKHISIGSTSSQLNNNNSSDESIGNVCKWVDCKSETECGQVFETTGELTEHIINDHIPSGKSSYVCSWKDCSRCDKPFTQKQKLIRHLNTHTKHKPFECNVCHKTFSLELMLKQHMRIHTGEKPYKCDICGKTFKTSSSLTIHLRIHTGDKPMVCKICGKRFNESSNLNKHMKIHFRKFKCEKCLKSFDCCEKFERHQQLCRKWVKP